MSKRSLVLAASLAIGGFALLGCETTSDTKGPASDNSTMDKGSSGNTGMPGQSLDTYRNTAGATNSDE